MKCVRVLCLIIIFSFYFCLSGFSQITGKVSYQGAQGPIVKVTAFESLGDGSSKLIKSVAVDGDGSYFLDTKPKVNVRLVFSYQSNDYVPAASTPLMRFVGSPSSNVDLLLRSRDFRSSSFLVSSVYRSGKGSDSTVSLVALSREDTTRISLASSLEIGCVYGIAFDQNKQFLYSSSFAKRHVGYGPLGTGGIYRTDWKKRKTSAWLDLSKYGIATGENAHQGLKGIDSVSTDGELMKQVGKVSFGGMDISLSGDTIYLINLFDRKLYAVSVPKDTATSVKSSDIISYQLPASNSNNGFLRPFAVKYYRGEVYVGAVSDASVSQDSKDLFAYVYKLDYTTKKLIEIFKTSLGYDRGLAVSGIASNKWNPWTDDFSKALISDFPSTAVYPQPILSSIAFGRDNEMILGFMDRFGHLSGPGFPNPEGTASYSGVAAGDIIRVRFAEKNKFKIEKNASDGRIVTEGKDNRQGPSGGEFYYQDGFISLMVGSKSRIVHEETATGSIIADVNTQELLASVHEPEQFNSGGIKSFFSADGKTNRIWQFYEDGERGTFGKANGMGAIAIVSEKQTNYIGNRIWQDTNGNGLQDTAEPGLPAIVVELWSNDQRLGSVLSDKEGNYIFDDQNVLGGITANTDYQIRVPYFGQTISAFKLGNDNELDNDAVAVGNVAIAAVSTGQYIGQHEIDFGFLPKSSENKNVSDLVVYPNPTSGQVLVNFGKWSSVPNISVSNLLGRKIEVKPVKAENNHQIGLDLSSLPAGVYVLTAESGDGRIESKSIIKITQ